MNDLYIHQLENENKQLRTALQECRKALEEEIATKKKAIEYIEECAWELLEDESEELLKILGGKENNTITLNTKDMNISYRGKDER